MTEQYVSDGDLGSGEPGSLQWHKCNLRQLDIDGKIAYLTDAVPNMTDADKLAIIVFLLREESSDGDGN